MSFRVSAVAVVTAASLVISGCAAPGSGSLSDGSATVTGHSACQYNYAASAGLGALGGALAGAALGGRKNALGGAAIGAAAGALLALALTSYLEKRCQALAAARAQMVNTQLAIEEIHVTSPTNQTEEGVVTAANNPGMFPEASAQLSPEGLRNVQVLASAYAGTDRKLLITGNTDSIGTPESNLKLSEARALTVAKLFAAEGIPAANIFYKGAGDTRPVDTNQTEEGRANNRRVEVVELQSEEGIIAFDKSADADPGILAHSAVKRGTPGAAVAASGARGAARRAQTAAKTKRGPATTQTASVQRGSQFDFGGVPVDGTGAPITSYVGAEKQNDDATMPLIGAAIAAEPSDAPLLDTACVSDQFRKPGVIRSLTTGSELKSKFGDHETMLYGSAWSQTVQANLVSLTEVSVLKDGGAVDARPTLYVFREYKPGDKTPSLTVVGEARAYVGTKGILYRAFFPTGSQPVRCIDVVFSAAHPNKTSYGEIYYSKLGKLYGTSYTPTQTPSN